MTATQVIWLLFIGMMVNFAGMRYFWLRSEDAEEKVKQLTSENKKLKEDNDGLRVCNQILRERAETAEAEIEDLVEQMEG